jgi:RNA polymerase sigma-70 factor, ECF subfamily
MTMPRRASDPRGLASQADALLVQVGDGNVQAFDALYDLVSPMVFGVARKVTREPELAHDVAQESMVDVWRNAARFDPSKGGAISWIATIVHRRAVDRVRSEQCRVDREARFEREARAEPSDDDHGRRLETETNQADLAACLAHLLEPQREAVRLAFYCGRTHQEVAHILAIPLGTAKTRIRQGLQRLRDVIDATSTT